MCAWRKAFLTAARRSAARSARQFLRPVVGSSIVLPYRPSCGRGISPLSDTAPDKIGDPSDYHQFQKDRLRSLRKRMEGPNRFVRISEREDRSDTPAETVKVHLAGRYFTSHRGTDLLKGPEDLIIYTQLFWYVKPATVIEIGAYSGGTAVWMSDMLNLVGTDCQVYSMDIDLSLLEDRVKELKPANLTFIQGDCYQIEDAFPAEFLQKQPHPWVVIEDAHQNLHNVLKHFHQFMQPGDYFAVEDTNPHAPTTSGMGCIPGYPEYTPWGPHKMNVLKRFLSEYEDYYAVDTFFTDYYGYNGSSNWHGYIRRMK